MPSAPEPKPGDRFQLIARWEPHGLKVEAWSLAADDDELAGYVEAVRDAASRTLSAIRRGQAPYGDGETLPRRRGR